MFKKKYFLNIYIILFKDITTVDIRVGEIINATLLKTLYALLKLLNVK